MFVYTVSESTGRLLEVIMWIAFGWWVSASSTYQLKRKHYLKRLHLKEQNHKSGRQQSEYNFLNKFDALFCSGFTEISRVWSKFFFTLATISRLISILTGVCGNIF